MRGRLRDANVPRRFQNLVKGTQLQAWWHQMCGGDDYKTFLLRFPDGRWDIPWELLIESLEPEFQRTVCLARALLKDNPERLTTFDTPLRILIVTGDDGAKIGRPINLDAEVAELIKVWESLSAESRQRVERPIVEKGLHKDKLPEALRNHQPHIFWFSGHGESRKATKLLFASQSGDDWVTAAELGGLIRKASPRLLYAIFWACETGTDGAAHEIPVSPSLFTELRRQGLSAILAMQSPIRDVSARAMAADLFQFLASGLSLERAVARARANQLEGPPVSAHPTDWACPVVWSAGEVTDKLTWNEPSRSLTQLQVFAIQAMRSRVTAPAVLSDFPTQSELRRAEFWISQRGIWIRGHWRDDDHLLRWVRTLRAVQIVSPLSAISIDLRGEDPASGLPKWAEAVHARLTAGDIPAEISAIFRRISKNALVGWRELCASPNIFLAVAGALPPERQSEWFWDPLLESKATFALLSDYDPGATISWARDSIDVEMHGEIVQRAVTEAPDLAVTLAVLNLPLPSYLIELHGPDIRGPRTIADWPEAATIIVGTAAGPVINSFARRLILDQLTEKELKQAQLHCVELLGNPELTLNDEIRERRLTHLIGAGLLEEALQEAATLCGIYRWQRRPRAIVSIVSRLSSNAADLPSLAKLYVGWAYLRMGHIEEARFWLDRTTALSFELHLAEKHGLTAEINKSSGEAGAKQAALDEIELAITQCRKALRARNTNIWLARQMLRAFQQDHARILQYLFYQKEAAAAEYEALIEELIDQSYAEDDLAIVRRNLAECLRTMPDAAKRSQTIGDLLRLAEQGVSPTSPALAEILYEKSRTADVAGDPAEAKRELEKCIDAALQCQNDLVRAVAINRYFWRYSQFSHAKWQEIKVGLTDFYPHGWAVRACVRSRLRAARAFEEEADYSKAIAELQQNLHDFERHPSFDAGRDRFRIAATYAGLQLLSEKPTRGTIEFWSNFLQRYSWAAEWLGERPTLDLATIWKEVT